MLAFKELGFHTHVWYRWTGTGRTTVDTASISQVQSGSFHPAREENKTRKKLSCSTECLLPL